MANLMERIIKKNDFGNTSRTSQSTVIDKNIIDAINRCSREIQSLNSQVGQLQSVNNQDQVLTHIKTLESQLLKVHEELEKKEIGNKEDKQVHDLIAIYEKKEDERKKLIFDHIHKESVKNFQNVQGILEENIKIELKSQKSIKRYLMGILWLLLLITTLIICNIIGVI